MKLQEGGCGVRQFQRGTRWPFRVAVWPSVVLSGWGHVEKNENLLEGAGLFFLTGSGGLLFARLVCRWQNLWVPMALHICMNLWWELFSVSRTAIGGWFPFCPAKPHHAPRHPPDSLLQAPQKLRSSNHLKVSCRCAALVCPGFGRAAERAIRMN